MVKTYIRNDIFIPRVWLSQFREPLSGVRFLILLSVVDQGAYTLLDDRMVIRFWGDIIPRKWIPASGYFSVISFNAGQVSSSHL